MQDCKRAQTPMSSDENESHPEKISEDVSNYPYQELLGSIIFLAQGRRPDISYAVTYLSQFNIKFTKTHWKQAKYILRYLMSTQSDGILYKKNYKELQIFSDASWNNDVDAKGFLGYIQASGAITWQC